MESIHLLCRSDGKWLLELLPSSTIDRQPLIAPNRVFTSERPWNQPFLVSSDTKSLLVGHKTFIIDDESSTNQTQQAPDALAIGCLIRRDSIMPLPMLSSVLQRFLEVFTNYFGQTYDQFLLTLSGGPYAHQAVAMLTVEFFNQSGFPFITEPSVLAQLVSPPSLLGQLMQTFVGTTGTAETLPLSMLSNTPWRRTQPQYPSSEIYIEQLEIVSAVISGNGGAVIQCQINGELWVDSRLNGASPEVAISLRDGQLIDDFDLHPCVRLPRFHRDRTLKFIPPDQKCRLMRYSIRPDIVSQPALPFHVQASVCYSLSEGKLELLISPTAVNHRLSTISPTTNHQLENISLRMRLPDLTGSVQLQTNCGTFHFSPSTQLLAWTLDKLPESGQAAKLSGTVLFQPRSQMNRVAGVEAELEFTARHSAVSGMRPDRILIGTEQQHSAFKAIKSTTRSGLCIVRCQVSVA